jgi:uroporphyrinogen decarboxylase
VEPLLVRACRREPVERTPVWFMRQAGRSLPEYRELRERYGLFEIVAEPELCAEVTLQPVRRHGVDAAVMFTDIMFPVLGMGRRRRPRGERRAGCLGADRTPADVERLSVPDPEESVPTILEAVRLASCTLRDDQAVIGFLRRAVHGRRLPRRGKAEPRLRARQADDVPRA